VTKMREEHGFTALEAGIWGQGVKRAGSFWGLWGRICQASLLGWAANLSLCPFILSSL
jgi:hypothetical protein